MSTLPPAIQFSPVQPRNTFYETQLRVAAAVESLNFAFASTPSPLSDLTSVLGEIRDNIGRLNRTDHDVVTAIYMVGVGPHGGISHNSPVGDWIRTAWRKAIGDDVSNLNVCDIAKLQNSRAKVSARQIGDFRDLLADSAGFPNDAETTAIFDQITPGDVDRFLGLAPSMCQLAKAHASLPSPELAAPGDEAR